MLQRLFCWIMALVIINASIDPPDTYLFSDCRENPSVNEMETIGELLLEKVMGFTNLVPEQDESDDNHALSKPFQPWAAPQPAFLLLTPPRPSHQSNSLPIPFAKPQYFFKLATELLLPPELS